MIHTNSSKQQRNDDTNTIIIPAERFAFKPLHTTMARAKGHNKAAEVPTKTIRRVHSYRSTDQGITFNNAKKIVLRMETIFDYEGIKAPNVPIGIKDCSDVMLMHYVYHFLKFHILFRKNKIAETKRWIVLEALKMCKMAELVEDLVFSRGTPYEMLNHLPKKVVEKFKVVFKSERNKESGISLFKGVDWAYLLDHSDYEGFNTDHGDDSTQYGIPVVPALIPKKRKSPQAGNHTNKEDWDKANFCEVCNVGIKCKYAFLTPGKSKGLFKMQATSEAIDALINDKDKIVWNKLQKGEWIGKKLETGTWAHEINRYMSKHWWNTHYDAVNCNEVPEWVMHKEPPSG